MDEFSFIKSIEQSAYSQASLVKGIGDDAAVFRQQAADIVTAKDMFVENVHFARHTMDPYHIGYKALASNLSDLAAMAAEPAFYLVGISIPPHWSMEEIDTIYKGMKDLAANYKMDLIGGDTVSGKELVISITVIGYVPTGKARYRSHASDGDIVFATGTLGDSQAGLHMLTNAGEYIDSDYFIKRHQLPSPRVLFALALQDISRLCLNDISDGIASEAHEIAEASNVTIYLNDEDIPVHSSFKQFEAALQDKWKLFGGEDYEIVGTVPKENWAQVQDAAAQLNLRVTNIGYVATNSRLGQVFLKQKNGKIEQLEKKGYNHLSR